MLERFTRWHRKGNQTAADIMEDAYEYLSISLEFYMVFWTDIFVLEWQRSIKVPRFVEEIEERVKVYDAFKIMSM